MSVPLTFVAMAMMRVLVLSIFGLFGLGQARLNAKVAGKSLEKDRYIFVLA